MRKNISALCWLNAIILCFLVFKVRDLLSLVYDDNMDHRGILKSEVNEASSEQSIQYIPRIIHQTYKNETCPQAWKQCQDSIKSLHPDYEYRLWTDDTARQFIEENYSWFLDTFDSYKYPIMRADAIRYFVLYHYGGIYVDLDNGVKTRLDPLLAFPAWLRKTKPTGVSNDIMASMPRHPFFATVINSLSKYNYNWVIPYITVMYSTGPLFISVIRNKYCHGQMSFFDALKNHNQVSPPAVRILMPHPQLESNSTSFSPVSDYFYTVPGSSWHSDDAGFLLFMARHITGFIIFYVLLGIVLLLCLFWVELKFINYISTTYRKLVRWLKPQFYDGSITLYDEESQITALPLEKQV